MSRQCRLCNQRPVSPSRLRDHDYRCSRCRNSSPAALAARYRYNRTPQRIAASRVRNPQRIFIGRRYHSIVPSTEQAERINAHIKERMIAFTRQPTGA